MCLLRRRLCIVVHLHAYILGTASLAFLNHDSVHLSHAGHAPQAEGHGGAPKVAYPVQDVSPT